MTTLIVIAAVLGAGVIVTLAGAWLIDRAHAAGGRFIEVGGCRQHVVELGEDSKTGSPPVVLLHGAGSNLRDMDMALGQRLAARHRVILIDRPGLGFSARKKNADGSPAAQAVVLRQVLDQLGVERPIIVGHSFGGTLALAFALDFPDRVAGLVLLAPPTHPGLWPLSRLNAMLASPIGWLFAYTLALPFGAILIWPGSRTAFLPQVIPRHYVKGSAAMLVLRPATLLNNWADVGCLEEALARQAERYGALLVPTILLNGDRDPLVPPEKHAMKLAAAAPVVKLTVLPGLGHMLHHAAPDSVVEAVEELASRV
jgi:pimeloyl-ACP methyl ester carboxylesterase